MIDRVQAILSRITMECLGLVFNIDVKYDQEYTTTDSNTGELVGRLYLQVRYATICTKTDEMGEWTGRKYYLSSHMTDDEIVKTAYVAFKQAVEHEVMEGFKVDNTILFNPHINYEELLKISHKEVEREPKSPLRIVQ